MSKFLVILTLFVISIGCSKNENCVENLKEDCICTKQYDPVCGCNDKTYGNACEADCANIVIVHTGECKK